MSVGFCTNTLKGNRCAVDPNECHKCPEMLTVTVSLSQSRRVPCATEVAPGTKGKGKSKTTRWQFVTDRQPSVLREGTAESLACFPVRSNPALRDTDYSGCCIVVDDVNAKIQDTESDPAIHQ